MSLLCKTVGIFSDAAWYVECRYRHSVYLLTSRCTSSPTPTPACGMTLGGSDGIFGAICFVGSAYTKRT